METTNLNGNSVVLGSDELANAVIYLEADLVEDGKYRFGDPALDCDWIVSRDDMEEFGNRFAACVENATVAASEFAGYARATFRMWWTDAPKERA
jgi:hypothetical protein